MGKPGCLRIANDWNKTIYVSYRTCPGECAERFAMNMDGKWVIEVKDLKDIQPNRSILIFILINSGDLFSRLCAISFKQL